jgi:hypothetical protein
MRVGARILYAGLLCSLAIVASACRDQGEGTASDTIAADTGAMGGLTPDQIRARAEPMSPARAESLGIVDTTIRVETQDQSDSLLLKGRPVD